MLLLCYCCFALVEGEDEELEDAELKGKEGYGLARLEEGDDCIGVGRAGGVTVAYWQGGSNGWEVTKKWRVESGNQIKLYFGKN